MKVKFENADLTEDFPVTRGEVLELFDSTIINQASGKNILHHIAATADGAMDIEGLLKEKSDIAKIMINMDNSYGSTPLHVACYYGNVEFAQALLENGAKFDHPNIDKRTPLHFACGEGCKELVTALVEKGANVNAQDKDGCTPLHRACEAGNPEVVLTLLLHGGDSSILSNEGKTPLEVAEKKKN